MSCPHTVRWKLKQGYNYVYRNVLSTKHQGKRIPRELPAPLVCAREHRASIVHRSFVLARLTRRSPFSRGLARLASVRSPSQTGSERSVGENDREFSDDALQIERPPVVVQLQSGL